MSKLKNDARDFLLTYRLANGEYETAIAPSYEEFKTWVIENIQFSKQELVDLMGETAKSQAKSVKKSPVYKEGFIYAVKHIEDPTNHCRQSVNDTHWSICVYRNNRFYHTGDCQSPVIEYENDEILEVHEVRQDRRWIGVHGND